MGRKLGLWGALVATATIVGAAILLVVGAAADAPGDVGSRGLAWLHPAKAGSAWSALRLPHSPARLPVPPGWHAASGDPGTRTAELIGHDGEIDGYLNATPQQGGETLADWSEFRVDHNREEGDRDVTLLASATGVRFRGATGSCVIDSYLTSSGNSYREVACLVAGRSASTVVVAAAPPGRWRVEGARLRRAIDGFTT